MLKNFLIKIWESWGIERDDKILLHSSFKRTFKNIKDDGYNFMPKDILDSLIDYILPKGTLVIPTFNFSFNNGVKYDYYKTPSEMGILTELARQHPEATRTLNPVYSFAVFGNDASKFKNINNESWYSKKSPFNIIYNDNYKICILDLNERNSQTFAHYCEEYFQVPWRYYKSFSGEYTNHNKETKTRIYKGYVRDLEKGVDTTLNPAGDLLWKKGKFIGNKPFIKNGFRYVRSKDYFDLFESLYLINKCDPYYYTIKL